MTAPRTPELTFGHAAAPIYMAAKGGGVAARFLLDFARLALTDDCPRRREAASEFLRDVRSDPVGAGERLQDFVLRNVCVPAPVQHDWQNRKDLQ